MKLLTTLQIIFFVFIFGIVHAKIDNSKGVVTSWLPKISYNTADAPIINKVTCSRMGKQSSYNSTLFDGYFLFDTEFENILTIEGSGFGLEGRADTRGIVTFTARNCTAPIVKSWTDTRIEIKFNIHPAASPDDAHLFLKTAGKNPQTVRYDFKFVPAVNGQQYGECTWWANKRFKEERGKSAAVPNPPYSDPKFKVVDANYEPMSRDIWKWNSEHQAFVESVKVKVKPIGMDFLLTYTLDISEANSDHKGTPKIYYSTVVEVEKKYQAYKTYTFRIISGNFGRPNGEAATHYYR